MNEKAIILEQRLIDFSISCTEIAENLTKTKTASHISGQLIRSCTSPALNYAEAQAAESTEDFIHKLKICLKELKETNVSLRIISSKNLTDNKSITKIIAESWELIAIFISSIDTARKNLLKAQLAAAGKSGGIEK